MEKIRKELRARVDSLKEKANRLSKKYMGEGRREVGGDL